MLQKQNGFSMAEVITVLAILSIAAAIGVPQLIGQDETKFDEQAKTSLQSGWESAQDYYAGERGIGQPEGAGNSYTGFNSVSARQLTADLPWRVQSPPTDQSTRPDLNNYSPSEDWAKAVFIMEVSDQSIGLCSMSRTLAFCMYDDGKASGADGKRYGARYGISNCGLIKAMAQARRTNTSATADWGAAYTDYKNNITTCS